MARVVGVRTGARSVQRDGVRAPLDARADLPAEASARRPRSAVIAGGYTGGHIFCALAIADALRQAAPGVRIILAGAKGGPELDAARRAGYPVEAVWIDGLDRRRDLRGALTNLLLPLKIAISAQQALRIVRRLAPDVVIGVGGYASAPLVAAASLADVPTLIHEANIQPGIANRLLGRRASVVCTGSEAAARQFPARRTVVTGNPVRVGLTRCADADRGGVRARLGLRPDRTTLLVTGGSLGAKILNDWVLAEQDRIPPGVQVLWQSGHRHHAACRRGLHATGAIRLVPFLDDMSAAYAAADLIVAGAGALTIAEVTHLGRPAILVPLPVAEDHQHANLRALPQDAICRAEWVPSRLAERVAELLADGARRAALGVALAALATPDAAPRIVAEILRLAGHRAEEASA